ncbi:MAG: hypothetical protein HOV81_25420 [Kofleriaceae bacterium]|nr:hypothetical protein [Kofleriaceae bacterium]
MRFLAKSLVVSVALAGCLAEGGGVDGEQTEQESTTTYVDILDFSKTDQGQWYDLIHNLNRQFDDVCGDTFCEGEYSNIQPLTFSCAVSSKQGSVKDCAWTFAAAQVDVDPRNANIVVDAPTYQCHFKMKTTAPKLIAILAGDDPLHAALPGAPAETPSIYDQLSDCFDHPIGQTPGEFAETGALSYVSARDYYTSSAGIDRWYAAKQALKDGFDRVCGDTFCSGDFGDLQAMDFTCAITKSTGNVKSCMWTFGGSWHLVQTQGGAQQITASTFKCPVMMHGTLSQLLDVLTAPGTDQPINRPLPGMTTSAYEALLDCLP